MIEFVIMQALIGICQDFDRSGMEMLYLDHFILFRLFIAHDQVNGLFTEWRNQ